MEISERLSGRIKETSGIARTLAMRILSRVQEVRVILAQESAEVKQAEAKNSAKSRGNKSKAKPGTAKRRSVRKKTPAKKKSAKR